MIDNKFKQYGYQTYNGKRTNYLSNETITLGDGSENVFEYKYTDLNDNPTSLIQKLTYTNGNQVIPVEYFYDANNRLIREVNTGNVTNYAYDNYGNITSRGGKTVDYDDENRIISYDGKTFKYASNNPYKLLSYGTYNGTTQLTGLSFTYLGRNISSITDHNINTTYSFTYDHQGRRITKQVNNDSVIQYVYLNNRLEAEIRSSYTLRFLYDEYNNLYGFYYNDIPYFYLRNALGTIYGIIDQTGKKVVEYTYDAWGKLLTTTRSNDTNNIASINPFIYKAYYYDVETQLFYCNSRYYSPEFCRWISPDSIEYLDPQSINGLNLYCYCMNNPVNYSDGSGHFPILAVLIGAGIGFLTSYIPDVISKMQDGFDWSDFNTFEDNWVKYVGATLGGAIGGLGAGLGTTILANGVGNVVEAAFAGDISNFGDVMIQFALGGVLGGVGYGASKGIASIFADKKIFGILGNLSDNAKVNKRLAKAGFGNLKIGKHGLATVYEKMYKKLGFETLEKGLSYGYDTIVGFIF